MAMGVARMGSSMRLGNARLGYYQPWVKFYINGTDRTGGGVPNNARTLLAGATITRLLNHDADTAKVRVFGFTPVKGQEIKIYLGHVSAAHQEFGGQIINVRASGFGQHVFYDLDCIDYSWLLNQRKVTKRYTNQSATAIIIDLIASFSAGFTTANVETDMPTIDEITFTNEDLTDAITRTMERVGGYWFGDYAKDIHAFTSSTDTAPSITDSTKRGARELGHAVDLSQVVTRVLARGGGAVTLSDCAVGQTSIPIEDPAWYAVGGGTVQIGPQNITYTSLVSGGGTGAVTGYVQPPNATNLSFAPGNGGGAGTNLTTGTYWIGASNVTADGETVIGALAQVTLTGIHNEIVGTKLAAPTDVQVTGLRFYIGTNGGDVSTLKAWQTGSGAGAATTYSWSSSIYDIKGANPANSGPLTSGTAGVSSEATPAGQTSLAVEDLAQFPSSGWAEAPGGQIFSYTGRSASSGSGTLTGIPVSGIGAITAPVRSGTIKAIAHLAGIAASGAGSILYEIKRGEQALVFVTRNDTAAQTALAGYLGTGDGIREYFFSDGRLSQTELENRADAILVERKDPITTVTLESRDPTLTVGKTVTFALSIPPISGTFKVQRVTITELAYDGPRMKVFPKRQVELSTRRFSFEDLVRQIKLVGRPN